MGTPAVGVGMETKAKTMMSAVKTATYAMSAATEFFFMGQSLSSGVTVQQMSPFEHRSSMGFGSHDHPERGTLGAWQIGRDKHGLTM
ncbi:hypothetical protein GCM10009604_04880 [Corynebacterium aurimucosum]